MLKTREETSIPIVFYTSDQMTPVALNKLMAKNIIYQDKNLGIPALRKAVQKIPGFEGFGARAESHVRN